MPAVSNLHIIGFTAFCFVAMLGHMMHRNVDEMLDLYVEKPSSLNDHCNLLVTDDGPYSSEDIANLGHGLILVADGDLKAGFGGAPVKDTHEGAMFVVDLATSFDAPISQQIRKVKLDKMPKGIRFKPHGIHYSEARQKLYALSHGFDQGGERIFIFSVVASPHAENRIASVSLVYERNIYSPELLHEYGTANDIVEGSEYGEVYITQWTQQPLPITGMGQEETMGDHLNHVINHLAPFLPQRTYIHRCVFTRTKASDTEDLAECTVAASGFTMVNGITVDETRKIYWAADGKDVHELVRESDGTLRKVGLQKQPHVIDNIEFDDANQRLYGGSIPDCIKAIEKMSAGKDVEVPGGLRVIDRLGKMRNSYDLVIHNGEKMPSVSAGYWWKSSVIMGSPFSRGVLRCELPNPKK